MLPSSKDEIGVSQINMDFVLDFNNNNNNIKKTKIDFILLV